MQIIGIFFAILLTYSYLCSRLFADTKANMILKFLTEHTGTDPVVEAMAAMVILDHLLLAGL